MRRKNDMLREKLLDFARGLADTEGVDAVNIRSIAVGAGVATGTVYNYFSGKDEILLALTEEYWTNALSEMREAVTAESFCGQLEEIFGFLREHIDSSAGKMMRSLGTAEQAGQEHMAAMQDALEMAMIQRMERDKNVRTDIWDETFTREKYARFIMSNMTMLLSSGAEDIHFFIEIVRRTIY